MSDITKLTKNELIEEVLRLRNQYEECSDADGGNGKFDEDALFALAGDVEGDELFLVTETGRFVYVNDTMQKQLGYSAEELLGMTLPRIDRVTTRAQWLHRVSRLKRSGAPELFESEQIANNGSILRREVSASYITYRARNYVLCVGMELEAEEDERRPPSTVRTREEILQQMTSDGVLIVDTRGTIIESNAVADRLLGVPRSEIITRSCVDSRWRLVDTAGAPLSISSHPIMIALVEEQQLFNRRIDMLTHDGSRRSLLINAAPLHDSAGELIGAVGCIRPFDDSAERGEELQKAKAALALERGVAEIVVHGGSEDDLERRICQLLVEYGGFSLVWRAVTEEKDERLHPSFSAGEQTDFLMKIKVRYDNTALGNGPLGKAMKTRETVAVGDLLADSSHEPWKRQAEISDLHSLVALPLLHEGQGYGLLTVYSKDRNHFIGAELKRMQHVADMLAYGISVRRRTAAIRQTISDHTINTHLLDACEEQAKIAFALFDADDPFRCITANRHFGSLLDEPFRSSGVEEKYVSDFMYALYHRDLYQQLQQAVGGNVLSVDAAVFTDWQGNAMQWNWRIFPVSSADGEDRLLYVAYCISPPDVESGSGTEVSMAAASLPVGEDAASAPSAAAPIPVGSVLPRADEPAVAIVDYPRFGPRSKEETRVSRFLEEGRVVELNAAAAALFEGGMDAREREASSLFGTSDAAGHFLGRLLSVRDSAATLEYTEPSSGRTLQCLAFFSTTDDAQRVCMVLTH
ncbi:MAG: PAS domain-containing protein [Bacteroidetes bacterium]|nr:PAS domain-containing protein [Bacteroidota bacterium]